ncbi:hypothetical protein [Cyanobium sp. Morenito 9A2]|nr:hypothetical protein [Cyanobium sp. Morenito 9A2]
MALVETTSSCFMANGPPEPGYPGCRSASAAAQSADRRRAERSSSSSS